ncbi:MAG: hypothetical protein ACI8R4_002224 [Paracoccaceae bacterium]|jgi:hypothetical protein
MLAAPDCQLSTAWNFWGISPEDFGRSAFFDKNTMTLRCAILGDAIGDKGQFRHPPTNRRSLKMGTDISGPLGTPVSDLNISLIDQLLLGVKTQGFAASGDWYQNSSLTIKPLGGTHGQN